MAVAGSVLAGWKPALRVWLIQVWKHGTRRACAGAWVCYDLDVPREQGLQRHFLLSDTAELLCSHILSLPRLKNGPPQKAAPT